MRLPPQPLIDSNLAITSDPESQSVNAMEFENTQPLGCSLNRLQKVIVACCSGAKRLGQ